MVVAPLVSLVLGTVAMLVVHAVVADALARADVPDRVRRWAPLLTVALLSRSASAPVLQVAYTEATALLGIATTLWAVQRHRYAAGRGRDRCRRHDPCGGAAARAGRRRARALPAALGPQFPRASRSRWRVWPCSRWSPRSRGRLLAARLTGVPGAYALTQGAWRARGAVVPLLPWLDMAFWLLRGWALPALGGLAALAVVGLSSRSLRALGPVLHAWVVGYVLYLVVVIEPGTSLVRFALLAFPAWAALAVRVMLQPAGTPVGGLLVVLGLAGQVAWVASSGAWCLRPGGRRDQSARSTGL